MKHRPFLTLALFLFCSLFLLTGCVSGSIPIREDEPSVTLPPAAVSFVAPIGDAALEYTKDMVLSFPKHDGMQLTEVTVPVSCSSSRPNEESLVRAMLSFPGNSSARSLGGKVQLSLYGVNPVEVSRDTATVNLSAAALQMPRQELYLACQAITNSLTNIGNIQFVNFLVVDKAIGLDIANKLPMGALNRSSVNDISADYQQRLSKRIESDQNDKDKGLSANVTLYFPLPNTSGLVSEVRPISFADQIPSNMIVAILHELAAGPREDILSPQLPLLAELLTADPKIKASGESGSSVIFLEFSHNYDDMLSSHGLTREQSMASLCYTLCTYFPGISGLQVTVNDEPLDTSDLKDDQDVSVSFSKAHAMVRSDYATELYNYATLYFPDKNDHQLQMCRRPLLYWQTNNPRSLISQLSDGPKACDNADHLEPLIEKSSLSDTDILGIALADRTLLVNFTPTFEDFLAEMNPETERNFVYAMVNTFCANSGVDSVCFFAGGSQFDGPHPQVYWKGLFYPMPIQSK